jgi:hypothetical protein
MTRLEVAIMYRGNETVTPEEQPVLPSVSAMPREGSQQIGHSLSGIELATLVRFDTIAVRTANSHYRLLLLDPTTGRALLEGGGQFTEPVEVIIIGSSFGGIMLRTGCICIGLRMEASANDRYIRTSPVQSVSVEHQTSPELTAGIS